MSPKALGVRTVPAGDDNGEYQSLLADIGATCEVTYVSNGKAPLQGIAVEQGQAVEDVAQRFLRQAMVTSASCWPGSSSRTSMMKKTARRTRSPGVVGPCLGIPEPRDTRRTEPSISCWTPWVALLTVHSGSPCSCRGSPEAQGVRAPASEERGDPDCDRRRGTVPDALRGTGPTGHTDPRPRDPTQNVSALDCYQSVDYVRGFGINTLRRVLISLGGKGRRVFPCPS